MVFFGCFFWRGVRKEIHMVWVSRPFDFWGRGRRERNSFGDSTWLCVLCRDFNRPIKFE